MSFEQQQYHSSPPPIYNIATPSCIYIDRKSVDQGRYYVKECQDEKNACGQLLRLIRSNLFL